MTLKGLVKQFALSEAWMCNAWNHPPDCMCGWGGEGHLGRGGAGGRRERAYEPRPPNARWGIDNSYCAPTRCRKCGATVYFIRHNGGSAWFDNLGWPWPKHACMDEQPKSTVWMPYIRRRVARRTSHRLLLGIIVRAKWYPESSEGPCRIAIAIDGDDGRVCVATTGSNTADYLLGRVAVADLTKQTLVTSNLEERPIVNFPARPEELGLERGWVYRKIKREKQIEQQ